MQNGWDIICVTQSVGRRDRVVGLAEIKGTLTQSLQTRTGGTLRYALRVQTEPSS